MSSGVMATMRTRWTLPSLTGPSIGPSLRGRSERERSIDRPAYPDAAHRRARPVPSGVGHAHADAGIGDTNADTDGGARATSRHHERHRKNEHTCASHGGHGSRSIG